MLDVGCGTGRLALALAERGAKVWGSTLAGDARRRRAAAGRRVGLKLGRAESLPFKDDWFERAILRLVVHLVDRPRAFSGARARPRAGGGRSWRRSRRVTSSGSG